MEIIARDTWGARKPKATPVTVPWKERTGFMVHYSGTSVEPTPKSVQNYHMDTQGWNDVGYNFLVSNSTGKIYEGRGWTAMGAHCAGHNTPNVGVVVLKKGDEPITDKAKGAVRWLAEQGDAKKKTHGGGGTLAKLGHRDRAATSCPGDSLYKWVKDGMKADSGGSTPSPAPVGKTIPMPATLRIGDGNKKAVRTVQSLINRDFPGRLLVDGVWREKTDAAVREWQVRYSVPNSVTSAGKGDGIWGPACWTFALKLG